MKNAWIWLSTDPLQEKYPDISTYTYANNNPVKYVDPNGKDWVLRFANNKYEVFYDRTVRSQRDAYRKYGSDSKIKHIKNGRAITFSHKGEKTGTFIFNNDEKNNKYGTVRNEQGKYLSQVDITEGSNFRIFGVSDESVNAATLYKNLFGSTYIGPTNPKDYNNNDSYQAEPIGEADKAAKQHDLDYDLLEAAGPLDAFTNFGTYSADRKLAERCRSVMFNKNLPEWDKNQAGYIYKLFNKIANYKESPRQKIEKAALNNISVSMPYSPF